MKESMHLLRIMPVVAVLLIGCGREPLDAANAEKLYYTDATERQRLKDALTSAGVPFEIQSGTDGREEIWYESRFEGQVRQIRDDLFGVPPPMGRSISLGAEHNTKLIDELRKRNAMFRVAKYHGTEYVAWEPESDEAADAALQIVCVSVESLTELRKMREAADAEQRDRTNHSSRSREERAPDER